MRKRFFISVLLLLAVVGSVGASPGSWRSHLAYHNATRCVAINDIVYVVSDGSLYSYNTADGFLDCYDKANDLSDQGIRYIAACDDSNTLVVVYENANIDFIRSDGSVVNITDFKNAITLDPTINSLNVIEGEVYLSTNFGATVLNVQRGEFGDTYMLGKVTYSCVELDDVIYAATEEGLYSGDMDKNLLDTANWELHSSEVYERLAVLDSHLIGLKTEEGVYSISKVDSTATLLCGGAFNLMHSAAGSLFVGNQTNVYEYTTLTNYNQLVFDGTLTYITKCGDVYWTCNGPKGLNGYRYSGKDESIEQVASQIAPNSPVRNRCQYLSFVGNERLLVAGGCLNYFGATFYDGTLMMYDDEEWKTFEENIAGRTAGRYKNMTSIVQDPKDPNHHYASSFGQGIYEFRDMKFVKQYTHKGKSGLADVAVWPLESAVPTSYEYTRISRLQYDEQGNLWISNAHAESPLKIMKPDGTFVNIYYPELEKLPTVTEVLFGSNGWVWVVSMQGMVRLFCIDMNGTLEDTSDDRIRTFNERFVDQDASSVVINYINDIAEDHNGDIWVMTDKGPYVLSNINKVFNDDYHFTKIKIPRNDGTNYADYLLDAVYTTCVEIDAANRKWIGTLNSGLYLFDSDELQTVHHFTAEDTPLPSNTIESLALNHVSGELFIGTDRGIVSYSSDATGVEETYYEDKVYAYPNPVVSYYDGLITVVGLKANTQVKVVNTAGRLVAEGTSLGGSFTWNGRTPQGQRVATGVYYVLGCDEEGREGIVTKVLFVK